MNKLKKLIWWIAWKVDNHCYGGMDFTNTAEYEKFIRAEWKQERALGYDNRKY